MSLDAEAEGFKTRLAAATKAPVYDHDEAQALTTLPAQYTIVHVGYRFGGNVRGGARETDLRRLTTIAVAKTVTNARLLVDRIMAEFRYSEVSFETGTAPEPDDGYYSASLDFTYVA